MRILFSFVIALMVLTAPVFAHASHPPMATPWPELCAPANTFACLHPGYVIALAELRGLGSIMGGGCGGPFVRYLGKTYCAGFVPPGP